MELNNFFWHTRRYKIDKNVITTIKYYVNKLFIPRTARHLLKIKYQVTGHYLCTKYILGCPELYLCAMLG